MANEELQLSIIERVKKELEITEDLDSFVLLKLLKIARRNSHPDAFPEDLKHQANERLTRLNSLYSELNLFINTEKLKKSPMELILQEDFYEHAKINNELILVQNENDELRKQLKETAGEISTLRNDLELAQRRSLLNSQTELINLYKPQNSRFILPSIMVILLFLINIVATLSTLKTKITPILPFKPEYLNLLLFIVLLLSAGDLLLKRYKYSKIQNISHEVISSQAIKNFYDSYSKENKTYYRPNYFFTETDVSEFIRLNYCEIKFYSGAFSYLERLFLIRDYKSINHLKNIFIENLIAKKLVKIGESEKLDRIFYII